MSLLKKANEFHFNGNINPPGPFEKEVNIGVFYRARAIGEDPPYLDLIYFLV
jgi:hypothetical protein